MHRYERRDHGEILSVYTERERGEREREGGGGGRKEVVDRLITQIFGSEREGCARAVPGRAPARAYECAAAAYGF